MYKQYPPIVIPDPDDTIYLDDDRTYYKMLSVWAQPDTMFVREFEGKKLYTGNPPTDIIVANMIPLPHFNAEFNSGDVSEKYTFNTMHDEEHEEWEVIIRNKDKLIVVVPKESGSWEIVINDSTDQHEFEDNFGVKMLLSLWYSVQILLLNPQTETLFSSGLREKTYKRVGSGKSRKRVVKYVRKHYVTEEALDEALRCKGAYSRKTLAWYVIGHWREYKNGKRQFIKGYWKGPLRKAKKSFDGGRTRELVS